MSCLSTNDQSKIRQLQLIKYSAANGDTPGLTASCNQMKQTGDDGSSINTSLAAACTSNQYNCSSACAQAQQKYYGLLNSVGPDSAFYAVYSSAYSQVSTARGSCDGLQVKGDSLASDGLQVDTSAYANNCIANSSMSPQSASGTPAAAASATPAAAAGGANSAASAAATAAAYTPPRGQAGMVTAQDKSNQFNLGSNADQRAGAPGTVLQPFKNGQPAQAATVPNGGGGGAGGMGGSGGRAAPAGPSGGRGGAGAPAYTTDIDKGFRSGGGSLAVNGGGATAGGDRAPASDPAVRSDGSVDLRAFLPGGSRDPARRLAGSVSRSQINLKEEDIWRRISNKIAEKCKLGELFDCH